MQAYQCDLCGRLFSEKDYAKMNTRNYIIKKYDLNYDECKLDICDNCYNAFLSLSKPKEEKPEFADDEIGAIAQEYGYILKHLRDCTIGEIVKICHDPDLKCGECEMANLDAAVWVCGLRKLTEADLDTIIRVYVPKINKEKTDE